MKIGSLAQLIYFARVHPALSNYNASAGALPYLVAAFLKRAGLDMVLVPYGDPTCAVADLAEGRLQAMVTSVAIRVRSSPPERSIFSRLPTACGRRSHRRCRPPPRRAIPIDL